MGLISNCVNAPARSVAHHQPQPQPQHQRQRQRERFADLLEHALRQAAGQCQVRVQTARLGASYISDEVSFALAGHALLDAYALNQATGMFFASWRSANPPIQQHLSNF